MANDEQNTDDNQQDSALDFLNAMKATRASVSEDGSEAPLKKDNAPAAVEDASQEMSQDELDARFEAKQAQRAAKAAAQEQEQKQEQKAPAAVEDASQEMSQDELDARFEAKQAQRAAKAAAAQKQEQNAPAQASETSGEMNQDAIDAMLEAKNAARAAKAAKVAQAMKASEASSVADAEKPNSASKPAVDEQKSTSGQDDLLSAMKKTKADAQATQDTQAEVTAQDKADDESDSIKAMIADRASRRGDSGEDFIASSSGVARTSSKPRVTFVKIMLIVNTFMMLALGVVVFIYISGDNDRTDRSGDNNDEQKANTNRGISGFGLPDQIATDDSGSSDDTQDVEDVEEIEDVQLADQWYHSPGVGVTWARAEAAYNEGEYALAIRIYQVLLEASLVSIEHELLSDLLRYRLGQCILASGNRRVARELFSASSGSKSPVIASVARRELGYLLAESGQHMLARIQAYLAIASAGALSASGKIELDCDFLVGRTLTEESLEFGGDDNKLAWSWPRRHDPFAGLSLPNLRRLIRDGESRLSGGFMGPAVKANASGTLVSLWCRQAPLEDVLKQVSTETGVDIIWDDSLTNRTRRRAVTLYQGPVSPARSVEVVAGQSGLISHYDGDVIHIYDPRNIQSVTKLRNLLVTDATRCWYRLDIIAVRDERVPKAHLALGRMLEATGEPENMQRARASYRLTAERFSNDREVAPIALLRSALLNLKVRDFDGAHQDLLKLLDHYPDFRADHVLLTLAQAMMEAGLSNDRQNMADGAIRIFTNLYEDNLSLESKAGAALGVAQCYFSRNNYPESSRWLKRYLGLVDSSASPDRIVAMVMLAKSESRQGNNSSALGYLYQGLLAQPNPAGRREISLEIANVQLMLNNHVRALGALRKLNELEMSPEQICRAGIIESRVYQSIGMPNRAIDLLNKTLKNKLTKHAINLSTISIELARMQKKAGYLGIALANYEQIWAKAKPSAETWTLGCEIAKLCVEMKKYDQAVAMLQEISKAAKSKVILASSKEILLQAYLLQDNNKKAGMSLASETQGGSK